MADNKPAELQAETLVIHQLLKYDIKTSKPNFDQEGADLLIIHQVTQKSTSFIKAQCKYRRILKNNINQVSIPVNYVTINFVLFLYAIDEEKNDGLYVFFPDDIRSWKIHDDQYWFGVSKKALDQSQNHLFTGQTADTINKLLAQGTYKNYTTVIIDGIFLERAISKTMAVYGEIWPKKVFKRPLLIDVIHHLLSYNQFPNTADVHCVLFLSGDFNLEYFIDVPDTRMRNDDFSEIQLTVRKTNEILSFQILDYLERVINVENIILVADDIVYEQPLNELKAKGIDIILVRLETELGGNLYTPHCWVDITYPLGLSLGLERNEL